MVATRFYQDLSIATRHKSAAHEAQRLANGRGYAITLHVRDFGAELVVGVLTGPHTLTFLPE